MKKIFFIIMLGLLLGCSKSALIDTNTIVKEISFHVNENEYILNEEKHEELINILSTYTYKEKVDYVDDTWKINVKLENDSKTYFIQPNGSIIDSNNCLYEFTNRNISDTYKEVLGSKIFQGSIIESKEWISNNKTLKRIFSFNKNIIDHISIKFESKEYIIQQDNIKSFVDVLNNTKYESYEDGLFYGLINSFIDVTINDDVFRINIYSSNNKYVIRIVLEEDKDGVSTKERTYYISKESQLAQLYEEMIAK